MDGTMFDTERLRFKTLKQAALEVFVAGPAKGKSIKATASESEAALAATEDQEDEK